MKKTIPTRVLYALVFISNMICIVSFFLWPEDYVYSYGLMEAAGGTAAIAGIGVAFAMWNVTYPFFIFAREPARKLGLIIIVQQVVGLLGELIIRSRLDTTLTVLNDSIMRFVWFDAGGLVLLVIGYVLLFQNKK